MYKINNLGDGRQFYNLNISTNFCNRLPCLLSEDMRKETISPFSGVGVETAVQAFLGDGLKHTPSTTRHVRVHHAQTHH